MQTKVTGVIGENFNFLSKPSLFSLSTLLRIRTKRGENGEGSGEKSLLRGITYFRYCLTVLSRFALVPLVTLVYIFKTKKIASTQHAQNLDILRTGTTSQIQKR